jgi:multiple sugar transport system substrate-binding protein
MKRTFLVFACLLLVLPALVFAQKFPGVTVTVMAHSGHCAVPWHGEAKAILDTYGIKLNVIETNPDELYSKGMLELTNRSGAYDIIQYNAAWIGDYEQYIQPLDEYVAKDNDAIGFADILPAFNKAQNIWGGKKMSVTLDGDTFLFYYRADVFRDPGEKAAFKAKYKYDLPDPPQTWKQVVDIAQFLTRKKGEKLAGKVLTKDFYGYADQAKRGRVYDWYMQRFPAFTSPSPHYFDPATMAPKINAPGAVASLENMKQLLKYSPPGVLSWEWDELFSAAMKDGTVGMWIHWTDEGRGFNTMAPLPVQNPPKSVMGITPVPGVEVGGKLYKYTMIDTSWVAGICADSKNKDAAYVVLKHVLGPGPVKLGYLMDASVGWDPARISEFNSKEWREKVPGIAENYLNIELKALESGYPFLKIPGAFEYMDTLDLNISKYLAGEFPNAKAALDVVAAKWNELNKKFGVDKQKGYYAKMWQ